MSVKFYFAAGLSFLVFQPEPTIAATMSLTFEGEITGVISTPGTPNINTPEVGEKVVGQIFYDTIDRNDVSTVNSSSEYYFYDDGSARFTLSYGKTVLTPAFSSGGLSFNLENNRQSDSDRVIVEGSAGDKKGETHSFRFIAEDFGASSEGKMLKSESLPKQSKDWNLSDANLSGQVFTTQPGNDEDWSAIFSINSVDLNFGKSPDPKPVQDPDIIVLNAPFFDRAYVGQGTKSEPTHKVGGTLENDVDFARLSGNDILASEGGKLYIHNNSGIPETSGFGNFVTIDHTPDESDPDKKIFTVYAHMNKIDQALKDGAIVQAGQYLGEMGNTGFAEGSHLHWGIFQGDPSKRPVQLYDNRSDYDENSVTGGMEQGVTWKKIGFNGDDAVLVAKKSKTGPLQVFDSIDSLNDNVCAFSGPLLVPTSSCDLYSAFPFTDAISDTSLIKTGDYFVYSLNVLGTYLNASVVWPGSELSMSIFDPEDNLVYFSSEQDGNISFFQEDPTHGFWRFRVEGIETAFDGEPFQFYASSPGADVAPVPLPSSILFSLFSIGLITSMGRTKSRRRRVS